MFASVGLNMSQMDVLSDLTPSLRVLTTFGAQSYLYRVPLRYLFTVRITTGPRFPLKKFPISLKPSHADFRSSASVQQFLEILSSEGSL